MNKRFILSLVTTILLTILFCVPVYAESFSLNTTAITLNMGESFDINAEGTDKEPVWTSYNINKVSIDKNGVVTAKAVGKTTVTARVGLIYKKCVVNVVAPTIKLNKTSATIYHGGTSTSSILLKATVKGATKNITWSSSNEEVAVVDSTGKVTSVGSGEATISATCNGLKADCKIIVKETSLSLNCSSMQLSTKGNGSSIKLIPTIVGSGKNIKWTTSDKTIAAVSAGKVTGKKTGTAIITATYNGISTTCVVNVISGLISINEEKVDLYTGETKALKTNKAKTDIVEWASSNEGVAVVDSTGKVTSVSAGTTIISAKCGDSIDTCIVNVTENSTNITEDTVTLKTKGTNKTYTLNRSIIGRKTTGTWKSSNTAVVTVSNGKLTAKKAGEATITLTANGITDSVNVVVYPYDPTIKLNTHEYNLYTVKGNTVTLKATVDGTSKTVTWESSNPDVATVSNKGAVKALSEGQTIISATANGVTDTCIITVYESKVVLGSENIYLQKEKTEEFPVDIIGTTQTAKYTVTNTKIVTLKNNVITAKANGETDIKVTANGVTSICHVVVADCEHSFDERSVIKDSTCTEIGTIKYTCINCGLEKIEEIPLKEHILSDWVITKESTETEEGLKERKCNNCTYVEHDTIPVIVHTHEYTDVVINPTCIDQGYTTHTCVCGDVIVDTYTEALGHEWSDWEVISPASEEAEGVKTHTCNRCNEVEIDIISKLDHTHSYSEEVVPATCTEQGYTTHTCSKCGDTYKDTYTEALGHNWSDWEEVTAATENTEGLKKHTCSRCKEYETEAVPKLDHVHDYVAVVTEATCAEQGYTTHTCSICNDTYKDAYIDALGHDDGEWEIVKEATCKEKGCKYLKCIRCKSILNSGIIEQRQHEVEYVVSKEPTCVDDGWKDKICKLCGDTVGGTIIFKSSKYHDCDVEIIEPTVCGIGGKKNSCKICGNVWMTDILPRKDSFGGDYYDDNIEHDYDYEGIALNEITDEYDVTCKVCGKSEKLSKKDIIDEIAAKKKLKKVISEIITDDMSDVEKIFNVNNWICANIEYDYSNGPWEYSGPYLNAMLSGKAMCQGYSLTFYAFMKELGIKCIIVNGKEPGSDSGHAWNKVRLDDGWYWIDTTWNDKRHSCIPYNDYFLRTGIRWEGESGVLCDGQKWKDGILFFEGYRIGENMSEIECYKKQKTSEIIVFTYDDTEETLIPTMSSILRETDGSYEKVTHVENGMKIVYLHITDDIKTFVDDNIYKIEHPEEFEETKDPEEIIDETYSAFEVQTEDGTVTVYGKFHDEEASAFLLAENTYRVKSLCLLLDVDEELTDIAKERALQCAIKYDYSVPWSEDAASTYYGYKYEMIDMGEVLSDTIDTAAILEQMKNSSEQRKKIMQMDEGLTGVSIFETKIDGIKKYFIVQVFKEY